MSIRPDDIRRCSAYLAELEHEAAALDARIYGTAVVLLLAIAAAAVLVL